MALGANKNGLDPTEIYAALRVADYGRKNYPTQAVFGKNTVTDALPNLTTLVPAGGAASNVEPISPAQDIFSAWTTFYPPIAGQMSSVASGDSTCQDNSVAGTDCTWMPDGTTAYTLPNLWNLVLALYGPYDADFLQIYDDDLTDIENAGLGPIFHDWVAAGGP